MKKLVYVMIAFALVLAACAPAAPEAPPAAEPVEPAPAEPAEEAPAAEPVEYTLPEGAKALVPLEAGSQSTAPVAYTPGDPVRIAYMPPATEFNYYMAIGAGIDATAAEMGVETFMLAPQSGADIATQMKMIQDAITQDVDAIILSTHDENAAGPLVKQAIDAGIAVVIVNSDIAAFPTPVNGVVGYSQRNGTLSLGEYAAQMVDGKAVVGVLEGLPGYHSTERIGGFLDAFANYPEMVVVASLPTEWNVETGNRAMMDMLQAYPEIELVVCANDYIAIGAANAARALGREDVLIFGNDGDTTGLEEIHDGKWTATVNTTPFVMGKIALQVTMDVLNGVYPGGWVETPTVDTDINNAAEFLCVPENLFPAPSVTYECP
jgi:ribose transport system substrate-binding protein